MKLLVISAAYPPMMAPEADHAYHLCQRLADRGVNVDLLTTIGSTESQNGRVGILPVMRDWSWSDVPRLARHVRRSAPDAVLLLYVDWVYNQHPMITFLPTIVGALRPNVTFVTQIEDPTGMTAENCSIATRALCKAAAVWAGANRVNYFFGTLICGSHRIIVLSDTHRAILEQYDPVVNRKSVLIPPAPILQIRPEDDGQSRRQGRETLGLAPEDFLFAYFGYTYPGKGVETLLKAFRHVIARQPQSRLAIIGGKLASSYPEGQHYAEEMGDLARQLGIDENVHWTGSYPWDSDIASMYLRATDACVFPLDHGVYLNNSSFAAAASHGLPLVATEGSPREPELIHRENVFLCPSQSVEALRDAMLIVLNDTALRNQLRAGAAKLAGECFNWKSAVDRTIATLAGSA
jgi:glycosyltransferase involved in cell wall biosynthesis